MVAKNGRSKAQNELADLIKRAFPFAHIEQEVFINRIIESHGYTSEEIAKELGHRPHKMFVDIYMQTSDGDYAFEYNGEQHYRQVGNMSATKAELSVNQMLDQEKSEILMRVGVPIVQIPFDIYVDESVLVHLMDVASQEMEAEQDKYYECDMCGRRFPKSQIVNGVCRTCIANEREKQEEYERQQEEARRQELLEETGIDVERGDDETEDDYKARMKEQAKRIRKERYRQMKASPEYQRQKAEAKERRKQMYRERKEHMKAEREALLNS